MSESQLLKPSEIKANVPKLKGHNNFHAWDNKLRSQLRICGIIGFLTADTRPAEPHRIRDTSSLPESIVSQLHDAESHTTIDAEAPPRVVTHHDGQPSGTRSLNDAELREWTWWAVRESRVRGAIEDTLDDSIAAQYNHLRSANEMYKSICAVYRPGEDSNLADQYIRQLNALKLKKGSTTAQLLKHLTTFNELNSKIITFGTRLADTELVRLFKGSLTTTEVLHVQTAINAGSDRSFVAWQREFATYVRHLQADEPASKSSPSVNAATTSKSSDKSTDKSSDNATVSATVDTASTSKPNKKKKGKKKRDPPTEEQKKKAQAEDNWCDVHQLPGHPTSACNKMKEAKKIMEQLSKNGKEEKGNGKAVVASISAIGALSPFSNRNQLRFLIDGGASIHLTSSAKYLSNVRELDEPLRIGLAWTDNYLMATHVGTLVIEHSSGKLRFPDVYVSKQTQGRILSEDALVTDGWTINKPELTMTKGNTTLHLDRLDDHPRLTFLTFETDSEEEEEKANSQTEVLAPVVLARPDGKSLEELHNRLGHLSRTKLLELIRAGSIDGVSIQDVADDPWTTIMCAPCASSKTTKLPRPGPSPRGNAHGEMIHCDLKGPINPTGFNGERYLCNMLADATGRRMLKPIKEKSHAGFFLREFITTTERGGDVTVKVVRTDGGGEFQSLEMRNFYATHGIQHQVSPPYDPPLNGSIERLNRVAGEHIAALMKSSQLPASMWPYAAMYLTDLLNISVIMPDGLTPHEKITGRKPNLANIRPFGEYVHARTHLSKSATSDKFTFERHRSFYGRALTRDPNYSAWWILEPEGTLKLARDLYQFSNIPLRTVGAPFPLEMEDDAVLNQGDFDLVGILPDPVADTNEIEEEIEQGENADEQAQIERVAQANFPVDTIDTEQPEPNISHIASFIVLDNFEDDEGEYVTLTLDELNIGHISDIIGTATPAAGSTAEADLEPVSVHEALNGPDADQWKAAMRSEIAQFDSKNTWIETTLPDNRRAISAKWVFKRKRDADGNVIKFKARLVARGFTQIHGIDYDETYAPVSRMSRLRLIFAIAATEDLELGQFDVEGAYLNGNLEEEIYLAPPDGVKLSNPDADVFQLKGSLYGLKQSGRVWWKEVDRRLASINFERCPDEWGLYRRNNDDGTRAYISGYVDDFVTATNTVAERLQIRDDLSKFWTISDLGEPKHILGVKVERDRLLRTITLSQPAYLDTTAKRFNVTAGAAGRKAPLPVGSQTYQDLLAQDDNTNLLNKERAHRYTEIVGTLQWIAGATRPDIAFAASFLGRANAAPTERSEALAERTLTYLIANKNDGLTLGGLKPAPLEGYADSDHAACLQTRRSTTGIVTYFNNSPISWSSRRQATVSQSSAEAEFIAASEGAREIIWLRRVLDHLGYPQKAPTPLFIDNEAVLKLGDRPTAFPLNKHIDIRKHMLRDYVAERIIKLRSIKTAKQRADALTKPLAGPAHHTARLHLRIAPVDS